MEGLRVKTRALDVFFEYKRDNPDHRTKNWTKNIVLSWRKLIPKKKSELFLFIFLENFYIDFE